MKARVISIKPVKRPSPRLVLMTGTPVSERPDNAYALIRLIQPELAISKTKFNAAFIETEEKFFGGQKVMKVKGYKNLDRLQTLLANISIRRTKDDVKGMPAKQWLIREVELSPAQRKIYNDLASKTRREAILASLGDNDLSTVTLRLRQVLHDPKLLGFDAPSAKFDALEDIAEEVLADPVAKLVCWINFVGAIPDLLKRFKEYKPIGLFADTPQAEMDRLNRTFDHSDERMVFVTPAKGSTGLNFLARARTAVYVEEPMSLVQYFQSQDRLVRRTDLASTDPIERLKGTPATLIRLRVKGSADDLTRSILERKEALAQGSDASIENLRITRDEFLSFISEIK